MRAAQRGQTMVIVALLMTAMVGFLGLSIDGGRLYIERRVLQNGADAASLAMSDAFFGAKENNSDTATSLAVGFAAGLAEFEAQVKQTGTWVVSGSVPTDCTVAPTSSTYPPSNAPGGGNVVKYTLNGYTLLLSAWASSSQVQSGICAFNAVATHGIATFFINVLSSITTVSATTDATSVSAHIFTPPTLLVLDPTCGGGTGTALKIAGGGTVTIFGSSRTDGNATVTNNTTVQSNGNFFDHCDNQTTVNGFGITYGSGFGGFGNASTETDPELGFAGRFPGYLSSGPPYSGTSPSDSENTQSACKSTALGCVVLEPGTFSATHNFPSGGGCWFVEPGIYDWASTAANALDFNSQGVVISNELTPPDGYNPATLTPAPASGPDSSESPQFNWNLPNNGGTSQPCNGEIKAYSIDDSTLHLGAKPGKYYIRLSSVREESVGGHNYWRESYLTSNQCPPGTSTGTFPGCADSSQGLASSTARAGCLPVQVTGTLVLGQLLGDQDIEIGISNIPGMGNPTALDAHDSTVATEYHIYASTTGCSSALGYVTSATAAGTTGGVANTFRQTIDKLTPVNGGGNQRTGCPYLPPSANPPVPNRSTGTSTDPAVTTGVQCSLGYNGSTLMKATNLGVLWSANSTPCDPSNPATGCEPPYLGALSSGTDPSTDYFAPDAGNEDECIDPSNDTRCTPNPFPSIGGVTPGGALFYFPNTGNCINQTQGAPFVFAALQWESVVLYTQALAGQNELSPSTPVDCGNGSAINGSEGGQFIGIVYSPDALLTVQGSGSPIDGGVVVWQLVLGGSSNTILTGRFPHTKEITPGHLIDCTNGGVSITTYCPNP